MPQTPKAANPLKPSGPILTLSGYTLGTSGDHPSLGPIDLSVSVGDVWAINAPNTEHGRVLLKALATFVHPTRGSYTILGRSCDLTNYQDELFCKQKIGYAAKETALISNLSIRQNLLLMRYYFENTLNISLHPEVVDLCRAFNILDKLDLKPSDLNAMENRAALLIRELSKKPLVFLFDQPEDFLGFAGYDALLGIIQQLKDRRIPIIFLSHDELLTTHFANRSITIADGIVKTSITHESLTVPMWEV